MMREITFMIVSRHETGGFVARWDDAHGGSRQVKSALHPLESGGNVWNSPKAKKASRTMDRLIRQKQCNKIAWRHAYVLVIRPINEIGADLDLVRPPLPGGYSIVIRLPSRPIRNV
jgi:hypothetical protein